jgi:hypothetical protein
MFSNEHGEVIDELLLGFDTLLTRSNWETTDLREIIT